jgi:hypothetical protein
MNGLGSKIFRRFAAVVAVGSTPLVLSTVHLKYETPHKTWQYCAVDSILQPLRILGVGPFKFDQIDQSVISELEKFGPDCTVDLTTLKHFLQCDSMKAQKVTNLGQVAMLSALTTQVMNLHNAMKFVQDNPAVRELPITQPVFVTGLFRSGTTFLHRLLALDPQFRSPLMWELMEPAPSPSPKLHSGSKAEADEVRALELALDRKARRDRRHEGIEAGKALGFHLDGVHDFAADLPEECQMAYVPYLPCYLMYSIFVEKDAYAKFPMRTAYPQYKSILQLLQFQGEAMGSAPTAAPVSAVTADGSTKKQKRWMLKSPFHLYHIEALSATFPDAQLIW